MAGNPALGRALLQSQKGTGPDWWSASQANTVPQSMLDALYPKQSYASGGTVEGFGLPQAPVPMFNTQSSYNNFASPNQSFMQYPQQGQPTQPQQGAVPSALTSNIPSVQNDGGPDAGGNYAATSMGFDNSGSDAGVGGQPVTQVQTPLQGSNGQPPSLSNYMSPQGLQIQGNPTSQTFNRGSRS